MKKLRPSVEEKTKLIEDITEYLACYNKGSLEDFSINDLIKEYTKIPKDVKKPVIQVSADAYIKMLELVNQSELECSWHGLVRRSTDKNLYYVYDILVFPQINSPATTTTDETEFANWQMKLISDMNFPIEDLRLHGHSHVNMSVFSSGVDDKYQKDLITKVDNGDYYIFFIMNKKMEICILLYDFDQQILFEKADIDFQIVDAECNDIRGWARKELKENATTASNNFQLSPVGRKTWLDDEERCLSYFGTAKPIFKGAKDGFK